MSAEAEQARKEKSKADARRRSTEWREANPEYNREMCKASRARWRQTATADDLERLRRYRRDYHLRHTFGISLEDYAAKLEQQNGVCAVCHQPETTLRRGQVKSLDVDHNHQTGAIRGLLCSACNASLGLLKEDAKRIRSLARYLESWQ